MPLLEIAFWLILAWVVLFLFLNFTDNEPPSHILIDTNKILVPRLGWTLPTSQIIKYKYQTRRESKVIRAIEQKQQGE